MGCCICTRRGKKRKDNYNFEFLENNEIYEKNDRFTIKTYLKEIMHKIIPEFIKQKYYFFEDLKSEKSTKQINKSTILIGLKNVGGPRLMNAILQCLSNTDKLTNHFLIKFKHDKDDDTKKIAYQYYNLLKHLWDKNSDKKEYAPKNFINVLSEVNPSLFTGIVYNSKDLLNCLLETLHKELNKKPKEENNNIDNNINQFNEEEVKQHFFKDFAKKNRSIISDLFYYTFETKSRCLNCNNTEYKFKNNIIFNF